MKKLALGLSLLAVAGCASHDGTHEHSFHRGVLPVVDTDQEARSMCSAVSYEQDRDRMLVNTSEMRAALASNGAVPVSDGFQASSPRSPELYAGHHAQISETLYLVAQFEAELDGSFDSIVQNCRAYNQCMIRNDYAENDCTQSAGMWADSQVRYHHLADRMADVRERVASACRTCVVPIAHNPNRPPHGHGPGRGHGHPGQSTAQSDTYYGPFAGGSGSR